VLLTRPEPNESQTDMRHTIIRIQKQYMAVPVEYDLTIQIYNGAINPDMPKIASLKSVLPLKVLVHKFMARNRADETGFAFLQDVVTKPGCPEFNGYNTANSRDQGQTLKPKTKAVYLPLIDITPSDPDTMLTALVRAEELTHEMGQEFVVITCDLQLYRVALHVTWAYMDRFPNHATWWHALSNELCWFNRHIDGRNWAGRRSECGVRRCGQDADRQEVSSVC
jgi:hypothetical protein